jgi:hypothetical protein
MENISHRDSTFLSGLQKQNEAEKAFWNEGKAMLFGIPVKMDASFRDNLNRNQFSGFFGLLHSRLRDAESILKIFPGLSIHLVKEKRVVARVADEEPVFMPVEFLYEQKNRVLFATLKAVPSEGVFAHELGHHIHGYFLEEDWARVLSSSNWKIEEDDVSRSATLDDIKKLIASDNEVDDLDGKNIIKWAYEKNGSRGKKYRHSNPQEMIAEVFADNYESILQKISKEKLSGEIDRRKIIDIILQNLE